MDKWPEEILSKENIQIANRYICCCSVAQSCPTLCDPMDCSTPGLPILQHFLEFAQIHVHWVSDAIQSPHPLLYTKGTKPLGASQVALVVKNLAANAGDARDVGLIPGSRKPLGVGNGNPLQYACLENPMNGEAWQATVHGVTKSQTWLSNFTSQWDQMPWSLFLNVEF